MAGKYKWEYITVLIALAFFIGSTALMAEKVFKDLEAFDASFDAALEKLKSSMPEIERVIEENPEDSQIRQGAAEIYWQSSFMHKAYQDRVEKEYKTALGLAPENEHLHTGLMVAYVRRFKAEQDQSILQELMNQADQLEKLWPDNAFSNYARAYVYLQQGEEERANNEIQKALTKPYLRRHLSSVAMARERVLSLIDFPLKYKISINPSFTSSHSFQRRTLLAYLFTKAEDLQELGKYEEAIDLYSDCIKILNHLQQDVFSTPELDIAGELRVYEKLYECYKSLELEAEANRMSREIERVKINRVTLPGKFQERRTFLITADSEEIEAWYEQMLEKGWFHRF